MLHRHLRATHGEQPRTSPAQRLSAGQNASPSGRHPVPTEASTKRWNIGRDVVAGVLLLIAPLFPWNLYFGVGIPDSSGAVFALLAVATVLSLAAVAVTMRAAHARAIPSPADSG